MSSANTLILMFLVSSVAISNCHISGSSGGNQLDYQGIGAQVYCGRNLARMLAKLCFGTEKRSDSGTMYGTILDPYYTGQEMDYNWGWVLPAHKAQGLSGTRGKRISGGVASECCDKPCSIGELLSYC